MTEKNGDGWRERDWIWLVGILVGIICIIISYRSSDKSEIVNIISIGAGLVSLVVGVIAIVYSFIQNASTSSLLGHIDEKVREIDKVSERLAKINESVEKINAKVNHTGSEEDANNKIRQNLHAEKNTSKSCNSKMLTRFHFKIESDGDFDGKNFYDNIVKHFKNKENAKIIDASILTIPQIKGLYFSGKAICDGYFLVDRFLEKTEAEDYFKQLFENYKSHNYLKAELRAIYINSFES